MNCKILILILIASFCLQLTLAKDENDPKLGRARSKRLTRSKSSKTLRRSRTLKPAPNKETENSKVDSKTNSSDTDDANEEKAKLMKTLSDIGLAENEKKEAPKNVDIAKNIPVQRANKNVIIEGKNGKIFVDKVEKYPFQGDKVSIEIRDGDFYVNNNLVLRKGPRSLYGFVVYSKHSLNYVGVTSFTLKIDAKGFMYYTDSTGEDFHVNYFTRIG